MKRTLLLLTLFSVISFHVNAQFGGLGKKLLDKGTELSGGALSKFIQPRAAITTSFKDAYTEGKQAPSFADGQTAQPLYLLPKAEGGGYKLCVGLYTMINKSYCLQAGTRGPSNGDGYMLAPVLGPKEEVVISLLKNAESHSNVSQRDIQELLWAIIARTRFADYNTRIKRTATILLSPAELLKLEGGALGVLPDNMVAKAKAELPQGLQAIFEAENNIRRLAASGSATYEEMERYAMLAGLVPEVDRDYPSGTWSLHPDGYYIRFIPRGYSITETQIYVPQELAGKVADLIYDAPKAIACPANTGAQRLIQTNEPLEADYTKKLTTKCF